jgi:hypothetical protein
MSAAYERVLDFVCPAGTQEKDGRRLSTAKNYNAVRHFAHTLIIIVALERTQEKGKHIDVRRLPVVACCSTLSKLRKPPFGGITLPALFSFSLFVVVTSQTKCRDKKSVTQSPWPWGRR